MTVCGRSEFGLRGSSSDELHVGGEYALIAAKSRAGDCGRPAAIGRHGSRKAARDESRWSCTSSFALIRSLTNAVLPDEPARLHAGPTAPVFWSSVTESSFQFAFSSPFQLVPGKSPNIVAESILCLPKARLDIRTCYRRGENRNAQSYCRAGGGGAG